MDGFPGDHNQHHRGGIGQSSMNHSFACLPPSSRPSMENLVSAGAEVIVIPILFLVNTPPSNLLDFLKLPVILLIHL